MIQKTTKQSHVFDVYACSYNVLILNSFNTDLQIAFENKPV